MISAAVPCSCATGFASFSYWLSMRYFGLSAAICVATLIAPFVPWSPGDRWISAPYISSIRRRSIDTDSGITISRARPLRRQIIAIEIPVLPDEGSSRMRSSES
jgi:hypothetical protein